MQMRFATSPFGRRTLNAVHFAAQERLRQKHEENKQQAVSAVRVDRWKLLRWLTEARESFALSHRAIAVLEALASFHPEQQMDGTQPLIVFPSNAELSMRMRGMAPATIRRHIAVLVDGGFIVRRDSPNGKRFVRRDEAGDIVVAFGFDLSPFILRADEIEANATQARQLAREHQAVRIATTIHLRDVSKTIDAALSEERAGDWDGYADRLLALSGRVQRNAAIGELRERCEKLADLRKDVEKAYLTTLSEQEMSGTDIHIERHIQNSNIDSHFECPQDKQKKEMAPINLSQEQASPATALKAMQKLRQRLVQARQTNRHQGEDPLRSSLAPEGGEQFAHKLPGEPKILLDHVMRCCPQIKDYARDGIENWRDLVATAGFVRSMLGVSPDAWQRACSAMGDVEAAITLAAILERSDEIRSPGGYLRALTDRAELGRYSVQPVLNALQKLGAVA